MYASEGVHVKKILVTGAEGFIGSHLTEFLVHRGFDVRALVMYNFDGSRGWLDSCPVEVKQAVEVVYGDIRDSSAAFEYVRGTDAVLHLAALIGIPYSYQAAQSYIQTNVLGTLNLLQAGLKFGLQQFIHTSTSEVYGSAQYVPMDESHPLQAQSPYAASKIAADQLVLAYHKSFGMPAGILRPFNTYGPRQSLRAVIPTIIRQCLEEKSFISLGSISPKRDLTFISDTVRAFGLALGNDRMVGEVINLGSGSEISVGELVGLIASIMSVDIEISTSSDRVRPEDSEVDRLLSDNSKALEVIGWKPLLSGTEGLHQGLKETIDWFGELENLRRYRTGEYVV